MMLLAVPRVKKREYSLGIVLLLLFNVFAVISPQQGISENSSLRNENPVSKILPRLMSSNSVQLEESVSSSEITDNHESDLSSLNAFHTNPFFSPRFGISASDDLTITKISPEAMEKNATSMTFILNCTIEGAIGVNGSEDIENLIITNGSNFKITDWSGGWVELQDENGTFIDQYSLTFTLNNSFLTTLELGSYDLIMYTNVSGHLSSDSISLPMRDVRVDILSVSPAAEFNNKLDNEQPFTIEIQVKNYTTNSNFYFVDFLPNITNSNPKAIVKSTTTSGELTFAGFISNTTAEGRYTLNYSLPVSVSQEFNEGDHELIVSVTTVEGITDNTTVQFTAKGTIYYVILEELTVESYPPISYDDLVSGTQENIKFRLNVNDTLNVTFHVFDSEQGTNSPRRHSIGYQNPNRPEDPTALLYQETNDFGIGSIALSATDLTPTSGYSLLFFVRGHRTSQEINKPSNMTIFWDLLVFDYIYTDNNENSGSNILPSQKALWVDVNESWNLELGVFYASDGSSAMGGNVSYKFGTESWYNLTDGTNGDDLDGIFTINYTHLNASIVPFHCIITSGSAFDPQGTLFVDKTAGDANFTLIITWTYLIIDMFPEELDRRLSTVNQTSVFLSASWAHDENLTFDEIIVVEDDVWFIASEVPMTAGFGVYSGLIQFDTGIYGYRIKEIDDSTYGITKFTNSSVIDIENPSVSVDLIWEEIKFVYSNIQYSNLSDWDNIGVDKFFVNYGEEGTLYIYGRHSFDQSPFNGTALVFAFQTAQNYSVSFVNGFAVWNGDLTDYGGTVDFAVMEITTEIDFDVLYVSTEVYSIIISWDKIVLTLKANITASHGTWSDIYVTYNYLISDEIVNPSSISYTLLLNNGTLRENVSWTHFRDFSFGPDNHTYLITSIIDTNTSLSEAQIQYQWLDIDMDPKVGDLVVYWIDDKAPQVVELYTYDFGNGTILIVVDISDDTEAWNGSGVDTVVLFDKRPDVFYNFLGDIEYIILPSGVYRYYIRYTYNQEINNSEGLSLSYFQFDFDEDDPLTFSLEISDQVKPDQYPDIVGDLLKTNTITEIFTVRADYDPYDPKFNLKAGTEISVFYLNLDEIDDLSNITDGDVVISVFIQDEIWSGINTSYVRILITDIEMNVTTTSLMTIAASPQFLNKRAELRFDWNGTLTVGKTYRLTVLIADNAGNNVNSTIEVTIEDHVAPRIKSIKITQNTDRILSINVTVNELGFGVEYVQVGIFNLEGTQVFQWVNLTKQVGKGSRVDQDQSIYYYATTTLPLDLFDLVSSKSYSIQIKLADKTGNWKIYDQGDLESLNLPVDGSLPPLVFHPYVLLFGAIILISAIIIGIRITSRTEGYDLKKIFDEGEKISREVILTQMDEYALGVTVNFFDQIQGPVPVIWEPALLEDQEQVMLDLSDKAFSTLEFIGIDETERTGTFDFSTGSYECTALGYSFAIDNPQARGGKENLTIVLLLRKEWGDNLLVFQDELTEKLREIRDMIETQKDPIEIGKKARELREYVSRLMLSFNKLYAGINYDEVMQEEF
ncbi:hypothetical protein CEE45_02440 [Candidatus Heimdallarchaeota archaeon B3_Heim]|nr:MAG: hypothetical protein CEE45_02440 [Candidatus Heimdallarchaeota archaeon B3_Heim]